jgi:pyruvate/2-oxoglutarate dehydrogenase complex dihydrolipoamide dehydrogenase (E3) component
MAVVAEDGLSFATMVGEILGASFLGLEGDEAIHCLLDIMYAEAPYTVIQRAMHIHPTVSEFIPTMMDQC